MRTERELNTDLEGSLLYMVLNVDEKWKWDGLNGIAYRGPSKEGKLKCILQAQSECHFLRERKTNY